MKYHFILGPVLMLILSVLPAFAQDDAGGMKTFNKDGLSFSYPAGWTLTDRSNAQAQHLILSQDKSSIIIMLIAYRELLTNEEQFYVGMRGITEPYVESIARNFAAAGGSVERDNPCIEIDGMKIAGQRIRGIYQKEPSTGEVYTLVKGRRFTNLIYIRADKDAPKGDGAWEAVYKSTKIDNPTTEPQLLSTNIISGGLLNSKALKLPMPEYSSFAKSAGATGLVVVQVTIDEQGNIIFAKAVTGHPLLQKTSEEAARGAKFSPTILCGKAIKVNGKISYSFIR
jgi:hypothetical protein